MKIYLNTKNFEILLYNGISKRLIGNWNPIGALGKGCIYNFNSRRKFRSQTSDNMQRRKSRGGKSQGGEVKKWEDQRRERVGSKKMQVRKSRCTVFFRWFGAPEGRKVTSLKRRVRSQLARWEMKIALRCGAKRISKSKCTKHTRFGPLLEVEMSKKCTPLWRESHFQVKQLRVRATFWRSDVDHNNNNNNNNNNNTNTNTNTNTTTTTTTTTNNNNNNNNNYYYYYYNYNYNYNYNNNNYYYYYYNYYNYNYSYS